MADFFSSLFWFFFAYGLVFGILVGVWRLMGWFLRRGGGFWAAAGYVMAGWILVYFLRLLFVPIFPALGGGIPGIFAFLYTMLLLRYLFNIIRKRRV